MKKYGEGTGIKTFIDEKSLVIEVPLDVLANAFKYFPDNYPEASVKRGKRRDFGELVAKHLQDETDSETGSNFIHNMLDKLFIEINEGSIIADGIVKFDEED